MLEPLISAFHEEFNLPYTLSSPSRCTVDFEEEEITCTVEIQNNILSLTGVILPIEQANTASFLIQLMEANLFGIGTRGGVISHDERKGILTLSFFLDYNPPYVEFREKMEDMISVILFWREQALALHQKPAISST